MNRSVIEVGGRELPCRLTMGAMLLYRQNTGEEVSQLTDADVEKMLWLMWCCTKSACRADGVEFTMDFELFCDSLTPADVQRWNELLGQQNNEEEEKKRGLSPSASEEPASIESLLGIAMGCMGMSRDDFCRCTPSEFYAAYGAWNDMRQQQERGEWERARMQCLCALQPYSKKQLTARDVMRFPWDESQSEEGRVKSEEPITHEGLMERYKKARERAGLK